MLRFWKLCGVTHLMLGTYSGRWHLRRIPQVVVRIDDREARLEDVLPVPRAPLRVVMRHIETLFLRVSRFTCHVPRLRLT